MVNKSVKITQKDRKIAIQLLSHKIARADEESIRYYGNMAWLNFGRPKTPENYDHTIHMLYFAVT